MKDHFKVLRRHKMNRHRRYALLVLVALLAGIPLVSCAAPEPEVQTIEVTRIVEGEPEIETIVVTATPSEPIRLGLYTPLTGGAADLGDDQRKGMTLAIEEINSSGGVLGRQLQLFTADNACTPEGGASAARELIELHNVSVLLGGMCSGATLSAMEVMAELGIPGVTTGASSPSVTEQGNIWEFRINAHDGMMGEGYSTYIANKVDSVIMLVLNDEYGHSADEAFRSYLEPLGVEVMGTEYYEREQSDYRAVLTAIKDANPEGIVMVGAASPANVFIRQFRELGMEQKLFTRGILDSEFVDLTADDPSLGEGMTSINYWTFGADPDFQEAYEARWGEDARFLAAVAYYGTYVIADAIERAGSDDPAAIRDALEETDMMTGMGPIKFDENRQAYSNMYVTVLKDGAIQLLEVIEQEQPS
jgi:branched-chain amino acid transport system substrate-binding protein